MDDLPSTFDMVVVGTGMPECIIAAAAARIGKSVLHIDRNGHYGGNWASFNFDQLLSYFEEQLALPQTPSDRMMEASWLEQLNDNERLVLCPKNGAILSNIIQKTFIKEEKIIQNETKQEENTSEASELSSVQSNIENPSQDTNSSEIPNEPESSHENLNTELPSSSTQNVNTENISSNDLQMASGECSSTSIQKDVTEQTNVQENIKQEWTMDDLKENRRKFNLDLTPKLLFARGSLIELLITSNIARYAEFQCVSRVLTFIDGHIVQVPCSRADVFSTKNVSVVEKRMLMKLLTFCMDFQKHPEEYRGYEGKPFLEFLQSRKVTPNIEHYVLHAIAMVDESCPTLQGLSATQKFMESLGRYGNSPFLWSLFGSAELPQCFCRLCAVFGGVYHLKRDADAVILDNSGKSIGVMSAGKKISCESLVMESGYAPLQYVPESTALVSRAIYITDSSILHAERQQNTLLRLPPVEGVRNVITVLEFGSLSFICPDNLYAVHMTCRSLHPSVEDDFKLAETDLFSNNESGDNNSREEISKPKILWCTYFRQKDTTSINMNDNVPSNFFLTSSPDSELDYESAVNEAREIFTKLYPDEEFLPRAPDPEDIVMDECANPGEKDEFIEDNTELANNESVNSIASDANATTETFDNADKTTELTTNNDATVPSEGAKIITEPTANIDKNDQSTSN